MLPQRSIIRTRYLTPFKILILILIDHFSRNLIPFETGPKLISLLLDYIQTCDTRQDPSPIEIVNDFNAITESGNSQEWLEPLQTSIKEMNNPDKLFQFMYSLIDTLEEKEQIVRSWEPEAMIMDKSSILGFFVRRCRLEFLNASILQRNELFTVFQQYAMTATGINTNDVMDIDTMDNTFKRPYITHKTSKHKHETNGGWWISEHYVDKFLTTEAERIEQTRTCDISPQALDKYLNFLQTYAPDLGKIHQVRFVNYIRTSEYEGAVANLHRFFDYCLLYRETPMYHYALLNLGILEAKFGHVRRAAAAFEEALNVARENQDDNCLDEVVSWNLHMKSIGSTLLQNFKHRVSTDQNGPNAIYLESMTKLTYARDMIRRGDSPISVFEMVNKSAVQSSIGNVKYTARTSYLFKSCIWDIYGFRALSEAYLDAAKTTEEGTQEDTEELYLLAAKMRASMGEFDNALQILEDYGNTYPDQSRMSLVWKQLQCQIRHQKQRQCEFIGEQLPETQDQQDLWRFTHPSMPEDHIAALHELALVHARRDCPEQYGVILDQCYASVQRTDNLPQIITLSIEKGRYHMEKQDFQGAQEWLIQALNTAKRIRDIPQYCAATIQLCEACFMADRSTAPNIMSMLDTIMPKVLTLRSLQLQSDLFLVYGVVLRWCGEQTADSTASTYIEKATAGYKQLGIDVNDKNILSLI
ncbi:predicted protein [Lichtheimia corymbifera JMRC:FSU:9682]|uniref:Anaphase-promoting complex subunit 5 n=1 Tax=Lichtheimia corymbifera JMRC:FSU:9682 TaxID=1263082 RepID=A0A068SFB9_9FUNG|nr:predicted protein [Lichtheimia corymbifera JMRC:FSU:9682]